MPHFYYDNEILKSVLAVRARDQQNRAYARAQREKVRLVPVLDAAGGRMSFAMKLGRTRLYIVRNMGELARRIEQHELTRYGKELIFSHMEEEIAPEDVPLLRHVALLGGFADRGRMGEFLLEGTELDDTMRLLIGREVEITGEDGKSVPARVVERPVEIGVSLAGRKEGAVLRVKAENVLEGNRGVYALCPEQGELACAFGEAFDRVRGLAWLAQMCPRGVRLDEEDLDAVCARVLIPGSGFVRVEKGEEIVRAHTPNPLHMRFFIGTDRAGQIVCRIDVAYETTERRGKIEPVRRDPLAEEEAVACVSRLFPERIGTNEFAFKGTDEELMAMLESSCSELEAYGKVLVDERLTRMNVQKRRAMSFGITPSSGGLLLRADLGGFTQEELNEAYAAYSQKRRYVRLRSGVFLSGEALEQAAEAAQVLQGLDATPEQLAEGVEVSQARAMYLDEALKDREQMRLFLPKEAKAFIERLREAKKTRAQQPKTLNASLRPYQLDGLSWMCALNDAGFGGLLADDMGLGKTVQALSLLLREKERGETVRALVVCPASLQLNWMREAERFAPSLSRRALMGGAKARETAIRARDAELLITSYDQLRRDAALYKGETFTHVLLDEAQQIKNAASQGAKAAKTLCAAHRFAMTGTPIENRLSELWSIFDFLMPGYLHSYKRFKERFESPIVRDGNERAMENLRQMIAPFVLRRVKRDVLQELPEKVETVLSSAMTDEQRRQYAAMAASLLGEVESDLQTPQGRIRMLAGLTRLRQLCCDPRLCLDGYEGGSGKLEQCVELTLSAVSAGHRILLFSQFTSMLALLKTALEAQGLTTFTLTGETGKAERQRLCDAFNAGEGQIFLISLKAGGVGLNLTGADTVIHYDPWWNLSAQNQATDRAHRIGQTRGVQVFRLIAEDSVEERILRMQEEKRALGEGVLTEGDALRGLNEEELRKLLRG